MPRWSADLVLRARSRSRGRPDRPPVLLYRQSAGRQLVERYCQRSAAAGVRPEMTVAQARALLPASVLVEPRHERRELEALAAMARWALRFSPIVAADPPDGLLIDIGGCERLFGGRRRLVVHVVNAVERLGLAARVVAAPTFACAWAVARYGSWSCAVVTDGDRRAVLGALPVAALRADRATVEALGEVGIERVEHLLDLPRASLGQRFGAALLRRLDQAMGRAPETIDPVRPVAPPRVERDFGGPATRLEAIELAARELLEELAVMLEQRESGARRVELRLDRPDLEPARVVIDLSRPGRDAAHLWTLLRPKLEAVNLGWGVDRMALAASRLARLPHEQPDLVEQGRGSQVDERAIGELVDVLGNRLGPNRVTRPEPVASHVPERAFRMRPAIEDEKAPGETRPGLFPAPMTRRDCEHEASSRRATDALKRPGLVSPAPSADRPSLLLARPEPITVIAMTPEGPPLWLRWREAAQRIVASAGPERIAPEWWGEKSDGATKRRSDEGRRRQRAESYARAYGSFFMGREYCPIAATPPSSLRRSSSTDGRILRPMASSLPTRDYFKVQDEQGRWLWIFRALESNRWFVHGLWA